MTAVRYSIVIERAGGNYSAYSPDIPGVVAVGDTVEACKSDIREGIAAYLAELAKEGRPAPPPTAILEHIEV